MSKRVYNLLLLAIFETGFIIRAFCLGWPQFWYDEAYTGILTRLPLFQMIQTTGGDVHPPAYYLIVWVTGRLLGVNELTLRVPSLLFSMAALLLAWRLAGLLKLGQLPTLAGLGWLALAPFQVHYAQEARMYAWLEMLVLLALVAVYTRNWYLLAGAAGLLLWSHNYGLFYYPVLFLLAAAGEIKRPVRIGGDPRYWSEGTKHYKPGDEAQLKQLFWAMGLPFLSWLPWVAVLLGQMKTVAGGYWIQPVTPGAVLYAIVGMSWGFYMPPRWQAIGIMLTFGLLAYAVYHSLKTRSNLGLLWLAFTPLLLAVIVSIAWKPILLFRGLVGSTPAMVFLITNVLYGYPRKRVNYLYAAALIIPVMLAGLGGYLLNIGIFKGNGKAIIQTQLEPRFMPGDIIAHQNDGTAIITGFYSQLPQVEITTDCGGPVGSLSPATRAGMGFKQMSWEEVTQQYKRVWLMGSVGPTSNRCEYAQFERLVSLSREISRNRDDELVLEGIWLYEPEKLSTQEQ